MNYGSEATKQPLQPGRRRPGAAHGAREHLDGGCTCDAFDGAAADVALPSIAALPPITVGAGLQTNFYNCDKSCIYSPGTVKPGDGSVRISDVAVTSQLGTGVVQSATLQHTSPSEFGLKLQLQM